MATTSKSSTMSPAFEAQLRETVRRVLGVGVSTGVTPYPRDDGQDGRPVPWRIVLSVSIETGRWRYIGTRVVPRRNQAGQDGYADFAPSVTTGELWNDAEERNLGGFGSNRYGNAVTKANVISGFSIRPINNNRVVWARRVAVPGSGGAVTVEWRFCEPNGIDGACPP